MRLLRKKRPGEEKLKLRGGKERKATKHNLKKIEKQRSNPYFQAMEKRERGADGS